MKSFHFIGFLFRLDVDEGWWVFVFLSFSLVSLPSSSFCILPICLGCLLGFLYFLLIYLSFFLSKYNINRLQPFRICHIKPLITLLRLIYLLQIEIKKY